MEGKKDRSKTLLGIYVAMHITGLIGLSLEAIRPVFLHLVVFHLVSTTALILYFQEAKNIRFWAFCSLIFVLGWLVEFAGVHTGIIFGSYQYGQTLGTKLFDIPLIIGVNWLMLVLSAGTLIQRFKLPVMVKILLAATSLMLLDIFIEPAAIHLDFWNWEQGTIPIKNYVAWFIISLLFFTIYFKWSEAKHNKLAYYLFPVQFMFFLLLAIQVW